MSLVQIAILSAAALLIGWWAPPRLRGSLLLAASLLAIFWLQPQLPVRGLDFWLPVVSVSLAALTWAITRLPQAEDRRQTRQAALLAAGVILGLSLLRYAGPVCCLTASRPPAVLPVIAGLGLVAVLVSLPYFAPRYNRRLAALAILLILALFIILKSPPLSVAASAALRTAAGQSAQLAGVGDLLWLGFSYLAFRLLHVLRDYQAGKLPVYSLGDFLTYALFFPAYPAGPIDRSQRFIPEVNPAARAKEQRVADTLEGGRRILVGAFKKFVIADSLALIALSPQNALQSSSALWTWVMLLAYSLRIYYDFSGYTDLAIGIGRLAGFRLPENFDRPYTRVNLTLFWNSWHMTLAQWFRAYLFNPLTRWLRSRPQHLPAWLIIFAGQMSTMLLIGLWHGITWNFLIWGAWHGAGLFAHNRWSDWTRPRLAAHPPTPTGQRLLAASGWLLTFLYVSLGWVWFALPTPAMAMHTFQVLAGR